MSVRMLTPALENLRGGLGRVLDGAGWSEGGRSLPDGPLAEAFAVWDGFIPEELDGSAEEDGSDDRPARPSEDESHEAEAQDAEQAVREDAQVLQEDREFGEEKCQIVDHDRSPKRFQGSGDLGIRQSGNVSTHAVLHCELKVSTSRMRQHWYGSGAPWKP